MTLRDGVDHIRITDYPGRIDRGSLIGAEGGRVTDEMVSIDIPTGATLDPIVSPQLATVATMLLVAVFVFTNTVSTDGSVGGIYAATLQLAQRTADNATKSSVLPEGMRKIEGSVNDLMGNPTTGDSEGQTNKNQNQAANQNSSPQNSQSKRKDEPKGR